MIENQGQWPDRYAFRADLNGGKFYLEQQAYTLQLFDLHTHQHHHYKGTALHTEHHVPYHVVRVRWAEASNKATRIQEQAFSTHYSFFWGKKEERWKGGVSAYAQAGWKELYSGIDVVFYQKGEHLKYDYMVAPHADPAQIQEVIEGADEVHLEQGQLKLKTSLRSITYAKPYAYQIMEGEQVPVPCQYTWDGQRLSYDFPMGYDESKELIIDPELIFSTYSGSTADNWGNSATFDADGNLYSAGTIFNPGFPTTTGAFDSEFNGTYTSSGVFDPDTFDARYSTFDVGLLKFSPDGSQLLAASYLGGEGAEVPTSTVVDHSGNLLVFGPTSSDSLPVPANGFQSTKRFSTGEVVLGNLSFRFKNGSDLFVIKMSSNLDSLKAGTYLGGGSYDGIMQYSSSAINSGSALVANYGDELRGEITVDDQNNVYIASNTQSLDFPVHSGALDNNLGGFQDGVVCKLNPGLSQLVFSTYLGGTGEDAAYSLKVNDQQEVFVTGGTMSDNFAMVGSPFQNSRAGGTDGFIAHLNAAGGGLIASTYLGTSAYDQSYFVDLDSSGNVFLCGQTEGSWPIQADAQTGSVYSNTDAGQFIVKLDRTLSTRLMSTVIGAGPTRNGVTPNISPTAFLVDRCNRIYISGWGGSSRNRSVYGKGSTYGMPINLTTIGNSFGLIDSTTDGKDFYLAVLSKDAEQLTFGGYFGGEDILSSGEHVDGGTCRFDENGVVYHAVCASCGGRSGLFPSTPNAYSTTNNSPNCNNAAFKLDLSTLEARIEVMDTVVCAGEPLNIENFSVGATAYSWDFGDGEGSQSGAENVTHVYTQPGQYVISLEVSNPTTCIRVDEAIANVSVEGIEVIPDSSITACSGDILQPSLPVKPNYAYQWYTRPAGVVPITNPNSFRPTVQVGGQDFLLEVNITDTGLGCARTVAYDVSIRSTDLPTDSIIYCVGEPLTLNLGLAADSFDFFWGPEKIVGGQVGSQITFYPNSDTTIFAEAASRYDSCVYTKSFYVYFEPLLPRFDFGFVYPDCDALPRVEFENTSSGAFFYEWNWGDGNSFSGEDTSHIYEEEGSYRVQLVANNGTCDRVFEREVRIVRAKVPNVMTPNGDGFNDTWQFTEGITGWPVQLFNRWGNLVYSSDNYSNDFDAGELPSGTYFYYIEPPDEEPCKGYLEIIR